MNDMNRQEAIELAHKIQAIRSKRIKGKHGKLSFHTLLRLKEMNESKRNDMMERLVRKGYAESVAAIEKQLNSKAVSDSVGGNAYCPAHKMSDKL